jgi:hypothetical protein
MNGCVCANACAEAGQLKEWEAFVAGALADENKTSSIILGGQRPQNPNAQPQPDQGSSMITESTSDPRYLRCLSLFPICLLSNLCFFGLFCVRSSGQLSGTGDKDSSVRARWHGTALAACTHLTCLRVVV